MLIYSKRFVMNETEVPAVVLDTDKVTVTENGDRQKITKFFTDYARYHLRYVAEINPERLQRLVDEGKIIDYLNDLEDRCFEATDRQVELWKENDKEYKVAAMNDDIVKMGGILNNLTAMAKEQVMNTMVYV